jgi:hypothetical protein
MLTEHRSLLNDRAYAVAFGREVWRALALQIASVWPLSATNMATVAERGMSGVASPPSQVAEALPNELESHAYSVSR